MSYLPDSIAANTKKNSEAEKKQAEIIEKAFDKVFNNADGIYLLKLLKEYCAVDYSKAKEEDIEKHLAMFRPEKAEEYELENLGTEREAMAKIFHEGGMSKYQAKKVSDALAAYGTTKLQAQHSKEGYQELAKKEFGESYETALASGESFLKNAFPNDYEKVISKLPNETLIFFHKIANAVQEKYGITDGGASLVSTPGTSKPGSQESEDAYWKEMQELQKRNHTMADIQKVKDKYGVK